MAKNDYIFTRPAVEDKEGMALGNTWPQQSRREEIDDTWREIILTFHYIHNIVVSRQRRDEESFSYSCLTQVAWLGV